MRGIYGVVIGVSLFLIHGAAQAMPSYKSRLPNNGMFDCTLCHDEGTDEPPSANPFGLAANANLDNGVLDWSTLYDLDSDGDGATNGQELGDPCGSFDVGETPPRTTDVSNPSDDLDECMALNCATPACDCGDDVDDADETCDGDDFGANAACVALGYATNEGATCTIACDAVDTSGCAAVCGNNVTEPGEDCDDGNTNDGDNCTAACLDSGTTIDGGGASSGCSTATPMSPALFFMLFTYRRRRREKTISGSGSSAPS